MIRTILLRDIGNIFTSFLYLRFSPESIYTPSDISLTRSCHRIPPWVDVSCFWMFFSPEIWPTIIDTTIEPCTLEWMKSNLPIIFFGSCKIDSMMCTIDISTPEYHMSLVTKFIHICGKFSIKNELILPCLLAFPTIWKINTKDIKNGLDISRICQSWNLFLLELYMRDSSLIPIRIIWKTGEPDNIILVIHSGMYPDTSTSISRLLCRIVVGNVRERREKILCELIWSGFDLLHEEKIWIMKFDEIHEFSFLMSSSDAIDVPSDDAHKNRLTSHWNDSLSQISKIPTPQWHSSQDFAVCPHLCRVYWQHGRRRAEGSWLQEMDWALLRADQTW